MSRGEDPTDADIVQLAADAAERTVFSRLDRSDVADLDVTVTFEDRVLEVDVYLNAPEAPDAQEVADDAARAGRAAVDDVLE